MDRLGYDRYGAVGNDAGSMITPELGRIDPRARRRASTSRRSSRSRPAIPPRWPISPRRSRAQLGTLQWFYENKFSFNQLMSQQPQTLAYAVLDSPVGLLAWNDQLFGEDLDADFILTNVMLYWLTGTGGSAARFYYEDAHATHPTEPTTVPIGLAAFGGDFSGIRRFAERDHQNIVQWTTFDHGGHFAAHKVPDLLVGDIRAFFGSLR